MLLLQVIDEATAAVDGPNASTAAASGYLVALLSLLSRRTILPAFDRFVVRSGRRVRRHGKWSRTNISVMPCCSRLGRPARPSRCAR